MLIKLNDRVWNGFPLSGDNGIFKNHHGKRLTKDDRKKGGIPLLTAGEQKQGVADFISNSTMDVFKKFISIDMFGNSFYHKHMCCGDDNIYFFTNEDVSEYSKLFITNTINFQKDKYSYGKQFRQKNADSSKILLPINSNNLNEPDYEYMEQYTKDTIDKKTAKYITYANSILDSIKVKEIKKLDDMEWLEFSIDEILFIKSGKRLTKADMIVGRKPFIGATDSNNGITEFVSSTNLSEDSNVLGVNYNGSVGETFYHPYTAIFSDDVKRLSLKNKDGNKFIYLFLKNIILQQKNKYQYAYKFNEKRLKRQKILLPVNENNEPDYDYMEQYAKNLMHKKIKQYLDYFQKQNN